MIMRIVTPQRMRNIEGFAINSLGIDGLLLMATTIPAGPTFFCTPA